MADNPLHLAERLLAEGQKTVGFFHNLEVGRWELQIYTDGGRWTVHEILAHLISAEVGNTRIIKKILAGGEGSPLVFDIDGFNAQDVPHWSRAASRELIDDFRLRRTLTADVTKSLTVEELERTGRHPFLGVTTVADILKLIIVHNRLHLRDIQQVLENNQ